MQGQWRYRNFPILPINGRVLIKGPDMALNGELSYAIGCRFHRDL